MTDRLSQRLLTQVQRCEHLERENKMLGAHKVGFVQAMFDAAILVKALKDVMKVPVVDDQFQVTQDSKTVVGEAQQALGSRA